MSDPIIVFGAAGFVGKQLVAALGERGDSVIALVRKHTDAMPAGVETHVGTFDQPEHFAPLLRRARVIIHVASCSTPGLTAGKPIDELDNNLRPTLALLVALQTSPDTELLYLSSGGTLYGDTPNEPATEQDVIRPRSYYGAGKAAAEHFIHAAAMQYELAATILRPSNVYGPGQTAQNGFGIIPTAFERILNDTPLTLWGDGSTVRDYLFIDDFIRLCLAVISNPMPRKARVFNASSGVGISLDALLNTIGRISRSSLSVTHDHSRAVDVSKIVLSPALATREYAWRPEVDLPEGLSRTWAWWQSRS